VESAGGGAARFGISLAQHLNKDLFEGIIIGLWDFGSAYEEHRVNELTEQGIQTFVASAWNEQKPYLSFISAFWKLRGELSNHPVDILHSHSEFGDIAAMLIKLLQWRTIIIRTSHGGHNLEWRKRPIRRILLTNLLYPVLFDFEIGINQATTDYLNRRWIIKKLGKKAIRIPNALDLSRFMNNADLKETKKKELGIPDDRFVIGSVGRLAEQKGFTYLLKAFEIALKNNPKFILLIAGEGELRDDLQKTATLLGISDHLFMLGARADIEEIYNCLDIFVNSSLWEGVPTVVLECMAAGVPIIATDIPGNREALSNQVNGILVPPRDIEKMALAIEALYSNPLLRRNLVEKGRETIESFRIDTIARQHEEIYQNIYSQY
jgi:glycosyltransferase involved in cell wall biosynthesis